MGKARSIPVYLEVGKRRVFACAVDWPGWCRSGKDADTALSNLADYASRYAAAIPGFRPGPLEVVERVEGDATTDFGAPGQITSFDEQPAQPEEAQRLTEVLVAAWAAFDAGAETYEGVALRKGPRGGGRELEAIAAHVMEADGAYLSKLGGTKGGRDTIVEVLGMRFRGEPPPSVPRSGVLWPPRYFVRRSAWHALDHAWEIEDRAR